VVGVLKDDQHQVAKDRATCEAGSSRRTAETNRDLKRPVTMLRDQTTRSKRAARQPNGRDRDGLALRLLPLEDQHPVLIAATAVVGLIA
jgi:hypothetical protein